MANRSTPTKKRPLSLYNKSIAKHWLSVNRYYAMNFNYFDMDPHGHKECEIMYIVNGCCQVNYWNALHRKVELKLNEGDYVFVDCQTPHQLLVEKGTPCRILNLELSVVPSHQPINFNYLAERSTSLLEFFNHAVDVHRGTDYDQRLHAIISGLHRELETKQSETSENQLFIDLLISQFLMELARQCNFFSKEKQGNKYVRKSLEYIASHYEQDIQIKDIAQNAGISSAYLQRIFKSHLGFSLVDQINAYRVEKAKVLLETSTLPIIDIAVSVGFNNRQHFTHTFKKLVGCSPGKHKQNKENYEILL